MDAQQTRLYFHLQRAAGRLKTAADRVMKKSGDITTSQAAVLAIIEELGPLRQNTVAAKLEQNEAAIAQMASKLEQKRLITRRRSSGDQRAWDVEITEEGSRALSKAKRAFALINRKLDSVLGQHQRVLVDQLIAIENIFGSN